MKSTGIVRKVDSLGRIVLPIGLRRVLGVNVKDPIEIFVDGDHIILKRYNPGCIFCDSVEDVQQFMSKNVCADCIEQIKLLSPEELNALTHQFSLSEEKDAISA